MQKNHIVINLTDIALWVPILVVMVLHFIFTEKNIKMLIWLLQGSVLNKLVPSVAPRCFTHNGMLWHILSLSKDCSSCDLDNILIIFSALLSSDRNKYVSVTTGSPGSPMEMSITKTSSALTIHWTEGDIGAAPVTGYVIEARPSGKLKHVQLFIYS